MTAIRVTRRLPQAGMSLIEVLVGLVIGLIGMLVIFQSYNAFEGQKRTTTVTNDAQESGLLALTAIEREARLAGYGMFYNNAMTCSSPTLKQYDSGGASTVPYLPVSIGDGASNASDVIQITYGTSSFSATPSTIAQNFTGSPAEIKIDNSARNSAFRVGDYITVGYPSGAVGGPSPCVRLQVSSIATDAANPKYVNLGVTPGASTPANPAVLAAFLPRTFSNSPTDVSVVTNMGQFARVQYSVVLNAALNGRLVFRDVNSAAAPNVEIADGIVSLQAQYGISTAPNVQNINQWVNAVNGGPGNFANPGMTEIGRIKAIRVSVVARSQLMEKDNIISRDLICANTSGTNTNGPCAWSDTGASPAPLIVLSGDPNWQRYRYRVYETIIPLRNVMWQSF